MKSESEQRPAPMRGGGDFPPGRIHPGENTTGRACRCKELTLICGAGVADYRCSRPLWGGGGDAVELAAARPGSGWKIRMGKPASGRLGLAP